MSPQLLNCSYCERPSVVAITVRTSEPVDPYAPPKLGVASRVDVVRYCGVEHQPPERVTP